MLHLDKIIISCCILCGMLAVYYMSLYVLVSIVIAVLIYVYYESQVNGSRIHVRGLTRPNPLRKFLINLRLQADSTLISVMKSYRQFTSVSNRTNTNEANGIYVCQERDSRTSTDTSRRGYANTSNHYRSLDRDNECNERRRTVSQYSVTSSDSFFNGNSSLSRNERSLYLTPKRHSRVSNDMSFSPKGSPWGTSVSPKLRSHGAGVKTVQTVAGPLLASTRYNININSGLYGDVNSPGFSSRVARYATDNSKSLTHQRQYLGPGQFPLVQLDRSASKLPVVSSRRSPGIIHSPVMVRVAPPETSELRLLNKSQILSGSCVQDQDSTKSVLEVLKEISRKRIHSQLDDDSEDDIVKRQRKGESQSSLEHRIDEKLETDPLTIGKRGREESPGNDDSSLQLHQQVSKRTRNNEILSSLSSSRNLLKHMKRKSSAADWSRSSTPILGKQLKHSRDVLREATSLLIKTNTSTTTNTTPTITTSTTISKLDKPEVVKPSEFLPKFAAVLDKNSAPVLNSVAALEAKRAYDTRTRLRSMLAVIAGDDDFMKKPDTQKDVPPATTSTSNFVLPTSTSVPEISVASTTSPLAGFAQSKPTSDSGTQPISASVSISFGGFTSSDANAVDEAPKGITSETTKSLFTLSSTPITSSTIGGNANSPITTSSGFTLGGSPSTPATTTSGFTLGGSLSMPTTTSSGFTLGGSSSTPATMASGFTLGGSPSTPETVASGFTLGGSLSTPASTAPGFTLGGSPSTPATTAPGFTLGGSLDTPATTAPGFTLGGSLDTPATTAPGFTLGASLGTPATTAPGFTVGGSLGTPATTAPGFTLGGSLGTPATTAPGFTVGGSLGMPATTAPGFTLGRSLGMPATTAPGFALGGSLSTPATTAPGFALGGSLGTPATTAPGFTLGGSLSTPATTASGFMFSSSLNSPSSVSSVSSTTPGGLFTTVKSSNEKETTNTSTGMFGSTRSNEKEAVGTTSSPFGVHNNNTATSVVSSAPVVSVFGMSNNKDAPISPFSTMSNVTTTSVGLFGAPKTSEKEVSSSSSLFGASASKGSTSLASPVGAFGTPKSNEKDVPNVSSTSAIGMFGTSNEATRSNEKQTTNTTPVGIFGTNKNDKETTSTVGVFGTSKPSDSTSSSGLFGKGTSVPSGMFSFGAKTSPGAANPFQMAAPVNQPGGFKFDLGSSKNDKENTLQPATSQPTSVTTLATTSQSAASFQFNSSPKPTFNFGNTATANGPTQNTGGFAFGGAQKPQQGLFSFGSNAATTTQSSTPGNFSFGATKPGGFSFSGSGTQSAQSSSTGGLFSSSASPNSNPFSGPSTSTPFGSSSSTASNPTPAGNLFGSGGTAAVQPFGQSSGGLFGAAATQASTTFGNTSTPTFGSGASAPISSHTSGPVFGSPTQPSSTFASGQPSAPLFGSSTTPQSTFSFGSSTSTPAVQPSAASTGTNLFSSGTTPFQFGTSNSSSNGASPAPGGFNFGTSGVSATPPTINFGAGTSGTPAFQFGAGGTSTPLFGAQTAGPNMFSIGSGSTAPRARTSRMRRQR